MLLKTITQLSELAAQRPIFLWKEEFFILAARILPTLELSVERMSKQTKAYTATSSLIRLLHEELPNEYAVAQNMQVIAKAFAKNIFSAEEILVVRLTTALTEFSKRSRIAESARIKRDQLKISFTAEQIREHDYNLFQSIGLMYCLEYYLAIYKAMIDQPTEAQQRWFIESPKVNLGTGSVPGIWKDMKDDEVLEKFIMLVLDDPLRKALTEAFYFAKIEVMHIRIDCSSKDSCIATYDGTSVARIILAIKQFNQELLRLFQQMGVQQLKSFGFTPYGFQPRLDTITL
jgi:hypothetical protein